jgi:4-hydroxy-3-methylbut-2-enyl diphosphate reductase
MEKSHTPSTETQTETAFQRRLNFDTDDSVEITIAPNAGACFGVVRAIKLGRQALEKNKAVDGNVYSLGPLIHNPKVVKELADHGVRIIESIAEAETGGTVILRSHGVQKELEQGMKDKGMSLVDATCPLVKKPQRIAASLSNRNHFLIFVGDFKHPEVKGVLSYYGKDTYLVTYRPEDVDTLPADIGPVGILAQTTIEVAVLDEIVRRAKARFTDVSVYNTICDATSIRQTEAVQLAQNADVMVVVGGKNSSNTCKLVKICKEFQPSTFHIEELSEIQPSWFEGKKKIGVTGGASTPHDFVDAVGTHIAGLVNSL